MDKNKEARKEAIKELLAENKGNYILFTLTELENILGVTHRTLLTYVKQGKLKAVKIGGKWKVSEANLNKFINCD